MAEHPTEEWVEAANCLATVAHQLSSVVHEANNMLQVIAGSAEMIQLNGSLPEPVLKRTVVIAEQAHRVSTLLGSVRELSRFAPSRDGEITDLSAIVSSALDLRRHALNRAHVSVTVVGGEVPVMARASWRPAMQVVLNLLLNAEQAVRGRQAPAIAIRLTADTSWARVAVLDNGGGGVPAEPPLFTLAPLPDAAPRLGLGLSASGWLAEREGGRLEVDATGDGTTAVLTLRPA